MLMTLSYRPISLLENTLRRFPVSGMLVLLALLMMSGSGASLADTLRLSEHSLSVELASIPEQWYRGLSQHWFKDHGINIGAVLQPD